jgi:hypothetical protein
MLTPVDGTGYGITGAAQDRPVNSLPKMLGAYGAEADNADAGWPRGIRLFLHLLRPFGTHNTLSVGRLEARGLTVFEAREGFSDAVYRSLSESLVLLKRDLSRPTR